MSCRVATPGQVPRMQTCLLPLSSQLAKVNGVPNAVEFTVNQSVALLRLAPVLVAGRHLQRYYQTLLILPMIVWHAVYARLPSLSIVRLAVWRQPICRFMCV